MSMGKNANDSRIRDLLGQRTCGTTPRLHRRRLTFDPEQRLSINSVNISLTSLSRIKILGLLFLTSIETSREKVLTRIIHYQENIWMIFIGMSPISGLIIEIDRQRDNRAILSVEAGRAISVDKGG